MREQPSEHIAALKMMKGENNPPEEDNCDYPVRCLVERNNKALWLQKLIINLCYDEERRCRNPPNVF